MCVWFLFCCCYLDPEAHRAETSQADSETSLSLHEGKDVGETKWARSFETQRKGKEKRSSTKKTTGSSTSTVEAQEPNRPILRQSSDPLGEVSGGLDLDSVQMSPTARNRPRSIAYCTAREVVGSTPEINFKRASNPVLDIEKQ